MNQNEVKKFKELLKIYYDSGKDDSGSDGIGELLEIKNEVEHILEKKEVSQ